MESKSDSIVSTGTNAGEINKFGGIDKVMLKTYGFYAIIIIIIIVVLYACYRIKETYMTEAVRSDSDKDGWDLRKIIHNYLKKQDNYLRQRTTEI